MAPMSRRADTGVRVIAAERMETIVEPFETTSLTEMVPKAGAGVDKPRWGGRPAA
jgi:hypothetical protein